MPDFASNPTFIAPVVAPYLGQATKVTMTAAQRANGFVPGGPVAAEHLNAELQAITATGALNAANIAAGDAANAAALAALRLYVLTQAALGSFTRLVDHNPDAFATTALYATYVPASRRILFVAAASSGGNLRKTYDAPLAQGPQTIGGTFTIVGLVSNGTRTVAAFTGGTGARWKLNTSIDGTWAASTTDVTYGTTQPPSSLHYDATNGHFLITAMNSTIVSSSPDGQTWTMNDLGATGAVNVGLAVVPTRIAVAAYVSGAIGTLFFRRATIATGVWAASGGTIPNVASEAVKGSLVAVGSTFVYASGFAGNTVRVHTSPDAAVWTLAATITVPLTFQAVRLLADPHSGMLYMVVVIPGGDPTSLIYASADTGATWLGPHFYDGVGTNFSGGVACAGGYLLLLHSDNSITTVVRTTMRMPLS